MVIAWAAGDFLLESLRRREFNRSFVDLVQICSKCGRPIEHMIIELAEGKGPGFGGQLRRMADQILKGQNFGEALKKCPDFLSPQIGTILCTGLKMNNLSAVIPACREILREPPITTKTATQYTIFATSLFLPIGAAMVVQTKLFVLPRMEDELLQTGQSIGWLAQFLFDHAYGIAAAEGCLVILFILAAGLFTGTSKIFQRWKYHGVSLIDWTGWNISWKRMRLQQTFSAMLAVLLDGDVPEAEAVRLAADCTANEICRRRVQQVIAVMEQGAKLDDAVAVFDQHGEFHWRLANALHTRNSILEALRGWHETLDAKAFQKEETAGHLAASGLVILNGLVVALIAVAIFGLMITAMTGASL